MITLEQIFTVANVFVLPFWAIMIILPNWDWTKRIMSSLLPFVLLALVYMGLFVASLAPETAQLLSSPNLKDVALAFSKDPVMATGWVHYLVMDLFVGRWIYWEGQRTGLWTSHSLVLCLFAGPMGLFSHILTASVFAWFRRNDEPVSETA